MAARNMVPGVAGLKPRQRCWGGAVWADVSHAESDRFSALFDGHAPHVYDYCRSLVSDRVNAAQAAQATFVVAHSLLDCLQDIGRLRTWLLALARLECRRAAYTRMSPPESSPGDAEPDAGEWRLWRMQGQRHTAVALLNALPAQEREVLDLVYWHYLSSADVGAVLGVPSDQASGLLAGALASFERAQQMSADADIPSRAGVARRGSRADALVAGVRVISTIPLLALPPSILAGAASLALDPALTSSLASLLSSVGDLAPDGFPIAPDGGNGVQRTGQLHDRARRYNATVRRAIRGSRGRLVMLSVVVLTLAAGLVVLAGSSRGHAKAHGVGQSFGQDPIGPSHASTRGSAPQLPITALLPKKQDHGMILPMLPAVGAPSQAPSRKPSPSPSAMHTSASPTPSPTPASPSPTPTSPSPTPTSPSPTPTSPSPTATVTP